MIISDSTSPSDPVRCSSGLIERVHSTFQLNGSMLVTHGAMFWIPTLEVATYRKLARTRDNALAPGRVRNRDDQDRLAGQRKWDELLASISKHGFLPAYPVQFVISSEPTLRLHQGHHRIGIAIELGIAFVPVSFWFADLGKPIK